MRERKHRPDTNRMIKRERITPIGDWFNFKVRKVFRMTVTTIWSLVATSMLLALWIERIRQFRD